MDGSAERDRRLFEEVWNRGDLTAIDALVAPDLVSNGQPLSPEAYRAWAVGWRYAFPDVHVQVERQVATEGTVASRLTWRATSMGELEPQWLAGWSGPAIMPTGRPVTWTAISMHRFIDGRMVEGWLDAGFLSLLRQVDVLPAER